MTELAKELIDAFEEVADILHNDTIKNEIKEYRNTHKIDEEYQKDLDEESGEDYLEEAYITLPESAQYDLEDRLLKIGFTLDDETSRYGSKNEYKSWHDDGTYDIHYQIITKDKFDETNWKYKVDELSDLLDLFEEDYDCVTTLNAALIDDGRITAGFDVRDCWVADEGTDQIAPPKPEKLTFIDGELEDTDDNKYVIDNITSHMDLSKDDIINSIVGKKNKKVEESWDEKVELEYTNLPITYVKVKPSYDWREPDDEIDIPIEIDYTYEVYKDDVIYEIANILLDESSKFDSYDDDSLNAYIEEHFDELLDKYYTEITDRFREYAIEDAEQNYELEED